MNRVQIVGLVIIGLCVIATRQRNEVWRDPVRLWEDTIRKSPGNVQPYVELAFVYVRQGDIAKALESVRRAPKGENERWNLLGYEGNFLFALKRPDEAMAVFREMAETARTPGETAVAWNNVGVMLNRRSRETQDPTLLVEAAEAFRQSAEADITFFLSFDSYLTALYELQQPYTAKVSPFLDTYAVGKRALLEGDFAKSVAAFGQLETQADKESKNARKFYHLHYAYALGRLGRYGEAEAQYIKAVRADLLFVEAWYNLGVLYRAAGYPEAARDAFLEVLKIEPGHVQAKQQLSQIRP